jgi:hypothetical protein
MILFPSFLFIEKIFKKKGYFLKILLYHKVEILYPGLVKLLMNNPIFNVKLNSISCPKTSSISNNYLKNWS